MTGGSLFDGIGGFPAAMRKHGITPVWASEIEPFPISVSRRHFPDMMHLGDVTLIHGGRIPPVDVITFGSPCQDLSVAGRREGLGGERSGLFLRGVDIIEQMQEATYGRYPTFAVWENVPGAFSSNRGRDFRAVLSELIGTEVPMPGSGGWAAAGMVRGNGRSLAWRVLDAQYWGVPQRRKRIYLVIDFRGQRAGEILFESEGLPGDSAPGEGAGEGVAGGSEGGIDGTEYLTGWDNQEKRVFTDRGIAPTLSGSDGGGGRTAAGYVLPVAFAQNQRDEVRLMDKAGALAAEPGMKQQTYICAGFKFGQSANAHGIGWEVEKSPTLMGGEGGNQKPVVLSYDTRGNGDGATVNTLTGDHQNRVTDYTAILAYPEGPAKTLTSRFDGSPSGGGGGFEILAFDHSRCPEPSEISPTLKSCNNPNSAPNGSNSPAILANYRVRRLTPLECERLQGLPDGWTDGGSDTARYKAIGNGLAQPCADFVIGRIAKIMRTNSIPLLTCEDSAEARRERKEAAKRRRIGRWFPRPWYCELCQETFPVLTEIHCEQKHNMTKNDMIAAGFIKRA